MGRRKWMGMIWKVGSDRQPGRLLRECRRERALWDGVSGDVLSEAWACGRRDAVSRVLDLPDSQARGAGARPCRAEKSVGGCVNVE
jgi:hypothetical protein